MLSENAPTGECLLCPEFTANSFCVTLLSMTVAFVLKSRSLIIMVMLSSYLTSCDLILHYVTIHQFLFYLVFFNEFVQMIN